MADFDKDFLHDKLCDWFQMDTTIEEKKELWKYWQDKKIAENKGIEYRDYLDKQAKEFAREKAIADLQNEDPNQTEGRDV